MRILLAPDSFKGSLPASAVARAMERGIRKVCPQCTVMKRPLADGGEGTAALLKEYFGARTYVIKVEGPLGKSITASYGIYEQTAIFDVASVIGLPLLAGNQRNPLKTSTYGVGELIIDALEKGVRSFIVGLGGSSTNDGGIGMLQALGVQILTEDGYPVSPNGAGLKEIAQIDVTTLDDRLTDCQFTVITDVDNCLLGKKGATYVYGPQKGATREMVRELEDGMSNYARVIKEQLNKDVTTVSGGGAAGGLGVAFYTFLQARLEQGIEYLMKVTKLEEEMAKADFVFTGEGSIDEQTVYGKALAGVARLSKAYHLPVLAFTGAKNIATESLCELGLEAVFPILPRPMPLEEALVKTEVFIEEAVENVMRLLILSKRRGN